MNVVPANLNAEVPIGAWLRICWVGLPKHHSPCLHHFQSHPDHGHNWPGAHVLHHPWEEWVVLQVNVVLLQEFLRGCRSFMAMRWNLFCSKCLMISLTRAYYTLSSLMAITIRSWSTMARMLAMCSCLMGLESTPTLLVLVSKYLWSCILGIYSHFSVLVYVFYFGHNYYVFYHSFPSLFWTLFILTSYYARWGFNI